MRCVTAIARSKLPELKDSRMTTTEKNTGLPGERWMARLRPIDGSEPVLREGVVKLIDFDPQTQIWTVEPEDEGAPREVDAKNLIERLT
jgi:hypothetical protein